MPGYSKLGGEEFDEEAEALDNETTYVEVAPRIKKATGKKQRVKGSNDKKAHKARCQ